VNGSVTSEDEQFSMSPFGGLAHETDLIHRAMFPKETNRFQAVITSIDLSECFLRMSEFFDSQDWKRIGINREFANAGIVMAVTIPRCAIKLLIQSKSAPSMSNTYSKRQSSQRDFQIRSTKVRQSRSSRDKSDKSRPQMPSQPHDFSWSRLFVSINRTDLHNLPNSSKWGKLTPTRAKHRVIPHKRAAHPGGRSSAAAFPGIGDSRDRPAGARSPGSFATRPFAAAVWLPRGGRRG
jgi:hypothetical protein